MRVYLARILEFALQVTLGVIGFIVGFQAGRPEVAALPHNQHHHGVPGVLSVIYAIPLALCGLALGLAVASLIGHLIIAWAKRSAATSINGTVDTNAGQRQSGC